MDRLFWVAMAIVLLVEFSIVFSALRMHVEPDSSRGFLGTRPVEILWTFMPALLLLALLFVSYRLFSQG